ncbi:outer membrane beta-barrel protein [Terrimonas pollutisoli]|uniref:outer membrane beta-barrel protein n=1 Tax=Terrimonas pollutisoli TaxID=3034147 RepID=UPI0023ED0976|nr:outer membrane beta-barrel protein [Terrimonas sp. H1YJ31]
MRENEFEKRVQQQMEEFKLRPSDAVWQKVEEELRKKKKRRVVFFIFLLAGFSLLGYTGYFLVNHSKQNIADQTFTQQTNNNSAEKNNTVDSPAASSTTSNENGSINQDPLTIKPNPTENSTIAEELKNDRAPEITKESGLNDKPVTAKILRDAIVKRSNAITEKTASRKKITDKKQVQPGNEQAESMTSKETADIKNDVAVGDEKRTNENIAKSQPDPSSNKTESKDELATDSVRKDSSLAKLDEKKTEQAVTKTTQKMNAKIRWGFDFGVGLSGMRDNAFLFSNGQKSMDRFYSSPINSGSGGVYTPPVSPSSTKAGPAFKLGIVAQKEITKRSSVSAGLQYAYLNTRMKVGSYWNTSVVVSNAVTQSLRLDAVYRAAPQKDYTNHYHLIQLPVQYHLQLNKGKKLPLLWNVGASLGYLVNTNALVYDTTAGGIYYRDNDIFNKWQVNLNTGFSFLFGKSQKIQWSVGPEISFGMNKLMKDAYSDKQYLLYGGLSGRIIFPRKK